MIPITAGILAGTGAGQTSRARAAKLTLAYVSGLALFYAILGLVAGLSGSLFGTVSASPWARFVIGNLLLVFGLAMLDVFPVSAPQRLLQWAGRLTGGSYSGVFLLGATSGIVAAPCCAPAFAAVLTWVATTRRTSACPSERGPPPRSCRILTGNRWTWGSTLGNDRCCWSSGPPGARCARRSSHRSRRRTSSTATRLRSSPSPSP